MGHGGESLQGEERGLIVEVEGEAGVEGVLDHVFAGAHGDNLKRGGKGNRRNRKEN